MSCCRDPLSGIVGAIEKRLNHQPVNHEFASLGKTLVNMLTHINIYMSHGQNKRRPI